MAEVNAKDLTTKTAPASTDSMLLFGTTSNEGAKITVDNLADNILGRLTTKTFANQVGGSSAATILAQLATLNSKTNQVGIHSKTGSNLKEFIVNFCTEMVESMTIYSATSMLLTWAQHGYYSAVLAKTGNASIVFALFKNTEFYTGSCNTNDNTVTLYKYTGTAQ